MFLGHVASLSFQGPYGWQKVRRAAAGCVPVQAVCPMAVLSDPAAPSDCTTLCHCWTAERTCHRQTSSCMSAEFEHLSLRHCWTVYLLQNKLAFNYWRLNIKVGPWKTGFNIKKGDKDAPYVSNLKIIA